MGLGASIESVARDAEQQVALRWQLVHAYMRSLQRIPQGLSNHEDEITITLDRQGRVRSPWPTGIAPQWDPTRGEMVILHHVRVQDATILVGEDGSDEVERRGVRERSGAGERGGAETSDSARRGVEPTPYVTVQLNSDWCARMGVSVVEEQQHRELLVADRPHWAEVYRSIGWEQGIMGIVKFAEPGRGAGFAATSASPQRALYAEEDSILLRRPGPSNAVLSEFLASKSEWVHDGRAHMVDRVYQELHVSHPVMWFILRNQVCPLADMRPDPSGEKVSLATTTLDEVQQTMRESLEKSIRYLSKEGLQFKTVWRSDAPADALLILKLSLSYAVIGGSGARLNITEAARGEGKPGAASARNTLAPMILPAMASIPPSVTMTPAGGGPAGGGGGDGPPS